MSTWEIVKAVIGTVLIVGFLLVIVWNIAGNDDSDSRNKTLKSK
jgi:hypothetical protein